MPAVVERFLAPFRLIEPAPTCTVYWVIVPLVSVALNKVDKATVLFVCTSVVLEVTVGA